MRLEETWKNNNGRAAARQDAESPEERPGQTADAVSPVSAFDQERTLGELKKLQDPSRFGKARFSLRLYRR